MFIRTLTLSAAAVILSAGASMAADGIRIEDPYARAAGKNAKAGAAFMIVHNDSDAADRLVGVHTDIAARAELHTHAENADGVMQMLHIEEGFVIPAGESHALKRGGDHVMLMGLNQTFEQGGTVPVTLVFENAGEIHLDIPVDLER